MNYDQVRTLHHAIRSEWDRWYERAPEKWQNTLGTRSPIVFTASWGQNWSFLHLRPGAVDPSVWCGDRDISKIRFISIALATEIECVVHITSLIVALYSSMISSTQRYHNFVERTPASILEEYGEQPLYNNWDPQNREVVDLDEYHPLTDTDHPVENLLYTAEGRRIRRRIGTPVNEQEFCGVLLNLETIHQFFNAQMNPAPDLDNYFPNPPENNNPRSLDLYPQAFLSNKGHYQSSYLPAPFQNVMRTINAHMVDPEIAVGATNGPVTGGFCQGYNRALHRIRFRVDSHDVQLAEQTAYAASVFVTEPSDRTKADAIRTKLRDKGLAFTRLQSRLQSPGLSKALRLENTYHIDCKAIDPEERTAAYVTPSSPLPILISLSLRSVYTEILCPLASVWIRPEIFSHLRPHLVVFKPNVCVPISV